MVRVFVDDGISFTVCEGVDVLQLLLDGDVTLAGGGVSGVSHGGAGGTGGSFIFHINHFFLSSVLKLRESIFLNAM